MVILLAYFALLYIKKWNNNIILKNKKIIKFDTCFGLLGHRQLSHKILNIDEQCT